MNPRPTSTFLYRILSLGLGALAALAGLASSAPLQASGGTASTSDSSGEADKKTEEYWTPERMKEAKPAPMPHPDASKGVTVTPHPDNDGAAGSATSEPGQKP